MNPKQVVEFAKENGVLMVDYKFMDFIGTWQHVSVPITEFDEDTFEEGQGFDGSSIRGWQPIHASDMILLPDPTSAKIDPFVAVPTLSLICNIFDPITKEDYTRDPRNIARKAEAYLKSTGIGDTAFFGPEAEFFIFDEVRYDSSANQAFSISFIWPASLFLPPTSKTIESSTMKSPFEGTDTLCEVRSILMKNVSRIAPTSGSRVRESA